MDLYLLAELKTISLKVTTVDTSKPPPDFKNNFDAHIPPILIYGDVAVMENDKIERHIMKHIPGGHNLFVQDADVAKLTPQLLSSFKHMLMSSDPSQQQKHSNALDSQLRKIDEHLRRKDSRFLTGDTLCCFDCELMSKLQHIIVAGKRFCGFTISVSYVHLWRYIQRMYRLDAFTQSCPSDQDIIHLYGMQAKHRTEALMTKHEELHAPTYTVQSPVEIENEE